MELQLEISAAELYGPLGNSAGDSYTAMGLCLAPLGSHRCQSSRSHGER
jgi:hypothetical protein